TYLLLIVVSRLISDIEAKGTGRDRHFLARLKRLLHVPWTSPTQVGGGDHLVPGMAALRKAYALGLASKIYTGKNSLLPFTGGSGQKMILLPVIYFRINGQGSKKTLFSSFYQRFLIAQHDGLLFIVRILPL